MTRFAAAGMCVCVCVYMFCICFVYVLYMFCLVFYRLSADSVLSLLPLLLFAVVLLPTSFQSFSLTNRIPPPIPPPGILRRTASWPRHAAPGELPLHVNITFTLTLTLTLTLAVYLLNPIPS
jgi:hypothetical protein